MSVVGITLLRESMWFDNRATDNVSGPSAEPCGPSSCGKAVEYVMGRK